MKHPRRTFVGYQAIYQADGSQEVLALALVLALPYLLKAVLAAAGNPHRLHRRFGKTPICVWRARFVI